MQKVNDETARIARTTIHVTDELNQMLTEKGTSPLTHGIKFIELLKRPQIGYNDIKPFDKFAPELSADIINKGIVLTGGGAMLEGLDVILKKELNVPIYIAESPLTCVAEGTGKMLENLNLIEE